MKRVCNILIYHTIYNLLFSLVLSFSLTTSPLMVSCREDNLVTKYLLKTLSHKLSHQTLSHQLYLLHSEMNICVIEYTGRYPV